jgi:CobQ-like glutamine amidotransferase family enzyme
MKRDIKSHRLLQLLTALNDTFSNRLFKVKEAIEHASQPASTLKAALSETFNGALPTSQQLGKYFETCQGRVIDGLRLEDAGLDSHDKVKLWGVVHV